jgi:hypothetical protein
MFSARLLVYFLSQSVCVSADRAGRRVPNGPSSVDPSVSTNFQPKFGLDLRSSGQRQLPRATLGPPVRAPATPSFHHPRRCPPVPGCCCYPIWPLLAGGVPCRRRRCLATLAQLNHSDQVFISNNYMYPITISISSLRCVLLLYCCTWL